MICLVLFIAIITIIQRGSHFIRSLIYIILFTILDKYLHYILAMFYTIKKLLKKVPEFFFLS